MKRDQFLHIAEEAFDSLPGVLLDHVDNVVFLVEDWPDRETLDAMGIRSREDLLGLYQGHPLTERNLEMSGVLPDRVVLYPRPIDRYARACRADIFDVTRDTLTHEVGHHFGFDEDELAHLEGRDEPDLDP